MVLEILEVNDLVMGIFGFFMNYVILRVCLGFNLLIRLWVTLKLVLY